MRRALAVLAIVLVLAAAVSYFGPGIALALFGVNIVETADAAAQYVGTVVTIFSALLGAGVAYVAYEERRSSEKRAEDDRREAIRLENVRTSAISLKSKLRAVFRGATLISMKAVALITAEKFRQLKASDDVWPDLFSDKPAEELRDMLAEWKGAADYDLRFDPEMSRSLAYLDNEILDDLFYVQAGWEEVRLAAVAHDSNEFDSDKATTIVYNMKLVLGGLFDLNHKLNQIILHDYEAGDGPHTIDDWLKNMHNLPR